jgi:hypothetical protein
MPLRVQVVPEAVINGTAFYNVSLFQYQLHSSYLSLVNGAVYYVSVRATSAGAQGLTTTASSGPVEARTQAL